MYIWICSCPVSGQILSVFTALPFPYQVFIFVSSLHCLFCQAVTACVSVSVMSSSFQVSYQNNFFLCVLFLHPAAFCQLVDTSNQNLLQGFSRQSLLFFFFLWVRALFRAVADTLPVLCRLVPLWFLCQHLFLKRTTWNTKPYKLSEIPVHLVV